MKSICCNNCGKEIISAQTWREWLSVGFISGKIRCQNCRRFRFVMRPQQPQMRAMAASASA